MCALYRPYFSSALTLLTQPSFSSFYQIQSQIKFKTELCKNYIRGFCQYSGNCIFAHGQQELRDKVFPEGQEKICRYYYESGTCPYGVKCQFKHVLQTISGVTIIFEEINSERDKLDSQQQEQPKHNCLHHHHLEAIEFKDELSSKSNLLEAFDNQNLSISEKEIKAHVNFEEILAIKESVQQQKEQIPKEDVLTTKKQVIPIKFNSQSIWSSKNNQQDNSTFKDQTKQQQQNQNSASTQSENQQQKEILNLKKKEAQKSVLQFLVENSHISQNFNFNSNQKEEPFNLVQKSQRKKFRRSRIQEKINGESFQNNYSSFLKDPISFQRERPRLNIFKRLERGNLIV